MNDSDLKKIIDCCVADLKKQTKFDRVIEGVVAFYLTEFRPNYSEEEYENVLNQVNLIVNPKNK